MANRKHGFYLINRLIKKAGKKLILWGASIGEEDLTPAKIQDLQPTLICSWLRETLTEKVLKEMQDAKT